MKQTVAEKPNEAAPQTSDDSGAQDDLDKILSEIDQDFEKDTKVPEQKVDKEKDDIAALKGDVDSVVSHLENIDIEKAVESVSSALDVQVPKRVIKAMLNDMAIDDPRVRKAFANRYRDPQTWKKVLKGAAKNIREEFSGLPDKQLSDDREALAASVRGASKTQVEDGPPDFSAWSDRRFEHWKRTGQDNPNL